MEDNEDMSNDPGNWKWTVFYFNLKDKRLFVPKRNPALGFTLNFGNSYSFLIFTALIIAIIYSLRSID